MTVEYRHRPISDSTPFKGDHEWSPFTASWSDTLDILDRELVMLDAEHVIIEVDVRDGQIRIDGMLRNDAKANSPACRLAFDSRFGPLQYATDKYLHRGYAKGMKQDWQHNLRAIALTLEALRKVERYGASVSGQQYAGYKQLGWTGSAPSHLTGDMAVKQLWTVAHPDDEVTAHDVEEVLDDPELLKALAKTAVVTAHPDKWHGSTELWDLVQSAKTALRLP